jgi:hypothetical protein
MTTPAEHPALAKARALPADIREQFVTDARAFATWKPTHRVRALSPRVLAVAATRIECAWAAYCDAVPGQNHEREWEAVLAHGVKLPEAVARALFPRYDAVEYAE